MRKVLLITALLSCLIIHTAIEKESVSATKEEYFSTIEYPIREQNKQRMSRSYKDEGPVKWNQLAVIRVLCLGFDGKTYTGEMVVHIDVAEEVCDIFGELFALGFKIEKMNIMDKYKANDDEAMLANNSSALCVRRTTDKTKWSNHSKGKAIDINPACNPYVRTKAGNPIASTVLPSTAVEYLDRDAVKDKDGVITLEVVEVFEKRGWVYGGDWPNSDSPRERTDYHHFEKNS